MHFRDEITKHAFSHFEVGDDAVFHGANGDNGTRGSAQHELGVVTHGKDLVCGFMNHDERRLLEDDAPPFHINEGGGGTKINGDVAGKKP